jgi:hypothetical protein
MTKSYRIEVHMDVVGSDGEPVGKVDHLEGADKIKLTKDGGKHHFITYEAVERVEGGKVRLNKPAREIKQEWEEAA